MSNADSYPKISVNKLGEFLTTSSASRRRRIVYDQKHPSKVIVPLYGRARSPIGDFLAAGGDMSVLSKAIQSLRLEEADSDWARKDLDNTADALELFAAIAEELPLDGVQYRCSGDTCPRLSIGGVRISVRPDVLLLFERRGKRHVGALKIHYIRDDKKALRLAGQEFVATLCHKWLEKHGPDGRSPQRSHCYSIDVFRQTLITAPTAITRRMQEIEAACQEIALLWQTV